MWIVLIGHHVQKAYVHMTYVVDNVVSLNQPTT